MQKNAGYKFLNKLESVKIDDIKAFFISDVSQALKAASSVLIKQKVELFEVLTCYETKNRYNVILNFPDGSFGHLFKCKEQSNYFSRNCVR